MLARRFCKSVGPASVGGWDVGFCDAQNDGSFHTHTHSLSRGREELEGGGAQEQVGKGGGMVGGVMTSSLLL